MTTDLRVPNEPARWEVGPDHRGEGCCSIPSEEGNWIDRQDYIALRSVATAAIERVGKLEALHKLGWSAQECPVCGAALAIAAETESECARLRVDAERYRWLRDERLSGYHGILFAQAMGWRPEPFNNTEIDAAIDAAIASANDK